MLQLKNNENSFKSQHGNQTWFIVSNGQDSGSIIDMDPITGITRDPLPYDCTEGSVVIGVSKENLEYIGQYATSYKKCNLPTGLINYYLEQCPLLASILRPLLFDSLNSLSVWTWMIKSNRLVGLCVFMKASCFFDSTYVVLSDECGPAMSMQDMQVCMFAKLCSNWTISSDGTITKISLVEIDMLLLFKNYIDRLLSKSVPVFDQTSLLNALVTGSVQSPCDIVPEFEFERYSEPLPVSNDDTTCGEDLEMFSTPYQWDGSKIGVGIGREQLVFDTTFDKAILPSAQKSMIPLLLSLSRKPDYMKYSKMSTLRVKELSQEYVKVTPMTVVSKKRFSRSIQMYDEIMSLTNGFEIRIGMIDLEFNSLNNVINEIGLVIIDRLGGVFLEEYLVVERSQSVSARTKNMDRLFKYHFGQGHLISAKLVTRYFHMVDKYVDIWMSYDKSSDFTVLARNGVVLTKPIMDCQLLMNMFPVSLGRQIGLSVAANSFGIRFFHEHNGGNDACVAADIYKCIVLTVRGEPFNKQRGVVCLGSAKVHLKFQ